MRTALIGGEVRSLTGRLCPVMSVKLRLDTHCSQEGLVNCLLIEVTEGQERKCWKQCVRVNANTLSPSLETFGSSLALIFTKGSGGQFKALLAVNLWTSAVIK